MATIKPSPRGSGLTSGGAGVRLTRHLGLDLEVLHVSGLDLSEDAFFTLPLTFAPPIDIEREGGLTAFLTNRGTFDFAQITSRVSYRF